jgi:hypothetical protein
LRQLKTSVLHPAKAMTSPQRQQLALEALAGTETVSRLAGQHEVSRKFVYRQVAKAKEALDVAFSPANRDDHTVLFNLPVTKAWLRQLILGLTLTCHSSLRGVAELFGDVFDSSISVGTIHNVLQAAAAQARSCNQQQDLSHVRIGAHDEIFQSSRPVLVGVDAYSTYCYLLSLEEHRDADTWGVRLLDLQAQGFQPEATVADAGKGIRAGQALAMPEVPCRGDVFHALQTVQSLVTFLENRAYAAIGTTADLQRKKARLQWRGRRTQGVAEARPRTTGRTPGGRLGHRRGHVASVVARGRAVIGRTRSRHTSRAVRLDRRRTAVPRAVLSSSHRAGGPSVGQPT